MKVVHDHFQLCLAPYLREMFVSGGLQGNYAADTLFTGAAGIAVEVDKILNTSGIKIGLFKFGLYAVQCPVEGLPKLFLFGKHKRGVVNIDLGLRFDGFQHINQLPKPAMFHFFLALHFGTVSGKVYFTRDAEHLRNEQTSACQFLVIGSAGPAALEEFKNFVIAYL